MSKRFLLILALAAWPLTANADATNAPTDNSVPNAASELGPGVGGNSTGSSTGDSSSLQPAGNNPLQSTTGDSTGLTAPNSSVLQAPASSDQQLQVLQGEADGPAHNTGDTGVSWWAWLLMTVAFAALVSAIVWLFRLRRRSALMPAIVGPEAPVDGVANEAISDEGDDQAEPIAPVPAEPTPSQRLRVNIRRAPRTVFEFVIDPTNTPLWVDAIKTEEASEHPPKLGTIYKNQDQDGNWSEYELTEFVPNDTFTLSKASNGYHVRYTVTKEGRSTELEYFEWMDEGNLAQPFTGAELEKLKAAVEAGPKSELETEADAERKPKPPTKRHRPKSSRRHK
jgi:hypothetical protein